MNKLRVTSLNLTSFNRPIQPDFKILSINRSKKSKFLGFLFLLAKLSNIDFDGYYVGFNPYFQSELTSKCTFGFSVDPK